MRRAADGHRAKVPLVTILHYSPSVCPQQLGIRQLYLKTDRVAQLANPDP